MHFSLVQFRRVNCLALSCVGLVYQLDVLLSVLTPYSYCSFSNDLRLPLGSLRVMLMML